MMAEDFKIWIFEISIIMENLLIEVGVFIPKNPRCFAFHAYNLNCDTQNEIF